jgi:hypothetical protein
MNGLENIGLKRLTNFPQRRRWTVLDQGGLKVAFAEVGRSPAATRASQGEASYRNLPQLLAVAKHPNVAVKATGQAGYALDDYPFRSIHQPLRQVFDTFGPRRMFWGTDITRMTCSWRQCITLVTEELPWLTGQDLELVMGQAFCDWIGWGVAAG